MSKPTTGRLAITAWRNDDYFEYPLRIVGLDARALVLKMEIRRAGDTGGPPRVRLDGVLSDETVKQGLRVAGVSIVDGVEVSDVRIRMDRGTLQELGYQGARGDAATFEYALLIGGRTRLTGSFVLPPHAFGSDDAPLKRPESYGLDQQPGVPNGGATLTISADGGATVIIDGADLVSAVGQQVAADAEQATADREAIEQISASSYRAVETYGDREAIPLDKRNNGMRVQVMQAGQDANGYVPRVFEWRTDLFAPGGWTGLKTEEELTRRQLQHGTQPQDSIDGLPGTLDAIRGAATALATVKVGNLRAQLLAGAAPIISWSRDGARPSGQTITWSGWSVPLRGDVESFELRDWTKIERLFVTGNSLSDTTGTTDQWSQQLAAAFAIPLVSVARGSSDARQIFKTGAAPLMLTLAGPLPAAGSVGVALINGVAPSLDSVASPASFLNSYGGDATPASMAGYLSDGTTSTRVIVSIARSDSTDYRVARVSGTTGMTFAGPVLFTPDTAIEPARSLVGIWIGNNYFFSGVPNGFGDYTNPQMFADIDAIVRQAAGSRIFILPVIPAAKIEAGEDWSARGPGTPYTSMLNANARLKSLYPRYWLVDAQGRDLIAYLQQLGSDGSAGDQDDVAKGFTPRSCRYDPLHLNAKGVGLVKAFVQAALALQALPPALAVGDTVRLIARGGSDADSAIAVVQADPSGDAIFAARDAAQKAATDTAAALGGRVLSVTVRRPQRTPLARDDAGNVPLWLEDGLLGALGLSSKLMRQVGVSLGVDQANPRSTFLLPIARDGSGNIAVWLDNGALGAKALSPILQKAIAASIPFTPISASPSAGQSILRTDGRSLWPWRARVATLESGQAVPLRVGLTGDSWIDQMRIPLAVSSLAFAQWGRSGDGFISVGSQRVGSVSNTPGGYSATRTGAWAVFDGAPSSPNAIAMPATGIGPDGYAATVATATATYQIGNVVATRLRIFYFDNDATFRWRVDGGAWTVVAGGSTATRKVVAIDGLTDAAHTLDIDTTGNTSTLSLHGFTAERPNAGGVCLFQMGNGDAAGVHYTSMASQIAGFSGPFALDVLAIILGTNDHNRTLGTAQYVQGLTDIITAHRSANAELPVILVAPAQGGLARSPTMATYRDAARDLAKTLGVEFVSLTDHFGPYASENARGQWTDTSHLSDIGARRAAAAIFALLKG